MKWTKYDPAKPPQNQIGICLFWRLDYGYPSGVQYVAGVYSHNQGLLEQAGDKVSKDIISINRLLLYKAHYIYPQDLEMPNEMD